MIELTASQIIAAASFLLGFIGVLLGIIHKDSKDRMRAMDERLTARDAAVLDLATKVSNLEGEKVGLIAGVDKISAEVIAEVRKIRSE